jgi:hypothetical protein
MKTPTIFKLSAIKKLSLERNSGKITLLLISGILSTIMFFDISHSKKTNQLILKEYQKT